MKIIHSIKEACAFTFATIMSCGPSQAFGAIRLLVDSALFATAKYKHSNLKKNISKLDTEAELQRFRGSTTAKKIAKRLCKDVSSLTTDELRQYLQAKLKKNDEKITRLSRYLRADGIALIPLLGAHLSWRIATDYKGRDFTPIFAKASEQFFQPIGKACSKLFFLDRSKAAKKGFLADLYAEWRDDIRYKIPVITSTRSRSIEGLFSPAKGHPTAALNEEAFTKYPTVILFHPSVGSAPAMESIAERYNSRGFNTLCVTIGGYPGSPGVTTTEATAYQDVEAIKLFLKGKGVESVGYHGFSMGSGFAFQGAAGETNVEGLETLFVVADKPYTSAKDVAGNIAGAVGRGFMSASVPEGRLVELPAAASSERKWIRTDGLNNFNKAKILKERNIPLYTVQISGDFLMGRNKTKGVYQDNFATDLIQARYPDTQDEQKKHAIKEIDSRWTSHFRSLSWASWNEITLEKNS